MSRLARSLAAGSQPAISAAVSAKRGPSISTGNTPSLTLRTPNFSVRASIRSAPAKASAAATKLFRSLSV